jgi:hypothetical protein
VSRRHASIRRVGGRYELVDLGSANGTTLNGVPVTSRPVVLENGDGVELGGDVELVFETSGAGRGVVVFLLLVLLAGAVAGGIWLRTTLQVRAAQQEALERATRLAAEGATAAEAGNPEMAKQRLQMAAGLLFRQGLLDDVQRSQIMHTAMSRLGQRLGTDIDLWAVFKRSVQQMAQKEEQKRAASGKSWKPECRLDTVAAADYETCLREWVREVLVELRQSPNEELPEPFVQQIEARQCAEHGFLQRSLERGRSVVPMMRVELEQKYLPPLIHYLALIESGYQTGAVSSAAAVGPWQFIPDTGRRYGLRIDGTEDDRRDFQKSTRAAADYLNDLLFDFGGGDLLLALASYNRGEQGVRNALHKLDDPFSDRSYWRLVQAKLLPEETSLYVARFLAAASAGEGGLPESATLEKVVGRPCREH